MGFFEVAPADEIPLHRHQVGLARLRFAPLRRQEDQAVGRGMLIADGLVVPSGFDGPELEQQVFELRSELERVKRATRANY